MMKSEQEVKCNFAYRENRYTSFIETAEITQLNSTIKSVKGIHKAGRNDADVRGLCFGPTQVIAFPRGLHNVFPNLTCFEVKNCGLKAISRSNFVGLENLAGLYLAENLLTSLPDDLFQGMRKLKRISFNDNKLKRLNSKLLKPLLANNIEYVGLRGNTKIDSFFCARGNVGSTSSLEELMNIIDSDCESSTLSHEESIRIGNKELWTSGKFSDFTINVEKHSFKVHKNVLAIHSAVFMTMFEYDNKESQKGKLIITDFSSEVVNEFLCYIYTGEIPVETNDAINLFAIAAKYEVQGFKEVCEKMILDNLNGSKACEVLFLGNLYESDKMKKLAFIELKKMFPGHNIPDVCMNQPERLIKVVKAKRKLDRKLAALVE